MTSRERVLAALNHKEADKVPVDFGGFSCSMINSQVVNDLREYYGLPYSPPKVADMCTMTAILEPDLQEVLGTDVEQPIPFSDTFGNKNTDWKEWEYHGTKVLIPADTVLTDDGEGGYFMHPQGDASAPPSGHMPAGSFYFDNIERAPEFDEENANPEEQVEDHPIISDEMLEFYKKEVERRKANDRAIVVTPGYYGLGDINDIPGPSLAYPKGIRDMTDWYTAPLLYPEYVAEVFDLLATRAIESFKRVNDSFGKDIDVVYLCGTDFGTQNGPMMNPDTIKELYVPAYKKMTDWIHENTQWKTLKHCCGGIFPIIPHFIEAGFDALNPVQISAAEMDPQNLKNTFGDDILFWGGGVDTQHVLPFGTPKEVREQVLNNLDIFSKNGGYIFNTVHCIQAETPIENIVAMLDAVKEFNGDK